MMCNRICLTACRQNTFCSNSKHNDIVEAARQRTSISTFDTGLHKSIACTRASTALMRALRVITHSWLRRVVTHFFFCAIGADDRPTSSNQFVATKFKISRPIVSPVDTDASPSPEHTDTPGSTVTRLKPSRMALM